MCNFAIRKRFLLMAGIGLRESFFYCVVYRVYAISFPVFFSAIFNTMPIPDISPSST